MKEKHSFEGLFSIAGEVFNHFAKHRHELKGHVKECVDGAVRKLDLVGREEFDVAFDMLAKARLIQEELSDRLAKVEAVLNLSSVKKTVKKKKTNLPSVKTKKKRNAKK